MSTRDDHQLCHNLYYETKRVTYLPRTYQLSTKLTATVDYARQQQTTICRQMIQQAADAGDNIGIDEYDEFSYKVLFARAELFVVTSRPTVSTSVNGLPGGSDSCVKAFIAIAPCTYARGLDTCLAEVFIFRSRDSAGDGAVYRSLLGVAVELTRAMSAGYTYCVVSATLNDASLLEALRDEGFLISAIIPDSINLAGIGRRENVVLTKHLGLPDREPRSLAEIERLWQKLAKTIYLVIPEPLMSLELLPRDHVFGCGLRCVCRNAREDDVASLYDLMTDASREGQGYSLNEHVTIDFFRRAMLPGKPCVVYEDASTGDVVGFSIIDKSWMSRTKVGGPGESDTLVAKQYRGQGIGKEIVLFEAFIMQQLGISFIINDTMLSNTAMINLARHAGAVFLGTIPSAAYRAASDDGCPGRWEDVVINYGAMGHFDDLVRSMFNAPDISKPTQTSSKI